MENPDEIAEISEEDTNENVLRKIDVNISPKYDVPLCYVEFFDNKKHKPKEQQEGKNGDDEKEENDEEESDSDIEILQNKKGVKFANNGEKPNVIVMVKQRSKRKNTTTIANLEPWGVDIKELTKHIKKSMAIGCSTTKTSTGQQIVIQGDVGEPVINLLKNNFHIPLKSITPIKKVKKAPEPKQPAAQPVYDLGPSLDEEEEDNNENKSKNANENEEEEEVVFENPNKPSKKNKQQQNQQQHQEENQHHENRGRGGNSNRGGRGRGGNNNRGGRGRGGNNNRGGRGRGRH